MSQEMLEYERRNPNAPRQDRSGYWLLLIGVAVIVLGPIWVFFVLPFLPLWFWLALAVLLWARALVAQRVTYLSPASNDPSGLPSRLPRWQRVVLARPTLLGVIVLAAALTVAGRLWWAHAHRPMFHNTFRASDRYPMPFWQQVPLPETDEFGTTMYVDFGLNLLLVVAGTAPKEPGPDVLRDAVGTSAVLRARVADTPFGQVVEEYRIHRQRDALLLVGADNTMTAYRLNAGEAATLFRQYQGTYGSGTNMLDALRLSFQSRRRLLLPQDAGDH